RSTRRAVRSHARGWRARRANLARRARAASRVRLTPPVRRAPRVRLAPRGSRRPEPAPLRPPEIAARQARAHPRRAAAPRWARSRARETAWWINDVTSANVTWPADGLQAFPSVGTQLARSRRKVGTGT